MRNYAKERADRAFAELEAGRKMSEKKQDAEILNKLMSDLRKERRLSDKQIFRHIYRK